jgi:hypothetical protein
VKLSVHVNGQALDALTKVGNLVVAAEWPDAGIGGPASAEFNIQLPPSSRPSWLVKDALAEVRFGGCNLLAGQIAEPDWDQGSITINGAAREGETTAAVDGTGKTNSTPDTVIDAAITRAALTWTRPASISATAQTTSDTTGNINSVVSLLAAYADESGTRLYVDPYRRLLKGTDPTTPTYLLQPGSGELAWTAQQQATRIYGAWHDAAGRPQITSVGSGATEQMVEMENLDPLDSTRATNILNNLLAKATAGGWTNGLTISPEQIVGQPHPFDVIDTVGAGCMFRLLGQRDPRPGRVPVGYVDFVCERAEWNTDDGTITLTPRGMVTTDWNTLLTEAGVEAVS